LNGKTSKDDRFDFVLESGVRRREFMTKRSIASLVSALICLALLNGCSSNKQKPQEITEPTEESVRFEISAFSDIPSSEQEAVLCSFHCTSA
jgi:ABC-type uncharacterized transport system auxiliary subunit